MIIDSLEKGQLTAGPLNVDDLPILNNSLEDHAEQFLNSDASSAFGPNYRAGVLALPDTDLSDDQDLHIQVDRRAYRCRHFRTGGICHIYKALPVDHPGAVLAIKMIQERWYNQPKVRRQFSLESQILRELNHPGVPSYVCRGMIKQRPFFAYRFIDSQQLIQIYQHTEFFSPAILKSMALPITISLLKILMHLHQRLNPVVHGDISAENILIDSEHQVRLIDFGCARFRSMSTSQSGRWVGKPSFATPEQAKGQEWNERSDIYQTGIIFYELVTGKRWNRGQNTRDKLRFAAEAPIPKASFLANYVSLPISLI
ncbi:MAG: protein kinase, partial [Pseudomonadota bacterium]